ncbi:hypothetical protein BX667DRAFT_173623 [Coemansia mojavensis]|nr:hypothetical protein BX667DRAFT_173623 [Coemansia mojavensis]
MAEQAGRELSNFAQAVRSHPRFDGKIETLSVDSLEEVLKGTFRILKVTDEVRQAQLALVMLNHNVLQSWAAYCHSEEMEEMATLAQLISFLKATYDTVSTAYQALDELVALRFNTDEDLPLFNQKFDYLVTRAEFPAGQPSMALNHYRRTMPVDIKKELFAADITTVAQAKNRALVLWQTWRALKTSKVNEATDNGPVPMEIDRVDVRGNQQYRQNFGQRRRLRYNPTVFPCTESEFNQRVNSGVCVYCGHGRHKYRNCTIYHSSPNQHNIHVRQIDNQKVAANTSNEQGNAQ